MSAFNWFDTRRKAFELRTKVLTNAATYSVKVGSVANNFVVDRVIEVVTTASGNNLVISLGDGVYPGQKLLIILKTLGHDETVTITANLGDSEGLSSAGDFVSYEWIDDTVSGWQVVHSQKD